MANVYVNLDLSAGGGVGTVGDPFDFQGFISAVSGATSNNYYMRGSNTLSANLDAGANFNISAWDVDTYGPWRLDCDSNNWDNSIQSTNLSNGILYNIGGGDIANVNNMVLDVVGSTEFYSSLYNNCTIVVDGSIEDPFSDQDISACIIKDEGSNWYPTTTDTVTLYDSISDATTFGDIFINGAGTVDDGGGNTFGYTLTSKPAFSATDLTEFQLGANNNLYGPEWAYSRSYYVDMTLTSGTSGTGTNSNPWNHLQLKNYCSPNDFGEVTATTTMLSGDNVYVKGIKEWNQTSDPGDYSRFLVFSASSATEVDIQGWDVSNNGIWGADTWNYTNTLSEVFNVKSNNTVVNIKDFGLFGVGTEAMFARLDGTSSELNLFNSFINLSAEDQFQLNYYDSPSPINFSGCTIAYKGPTYRSDSLGSDGVVNMVDTALIVSASTLIFSNTNWSADNVESTILYSDVSAVLDSNLNNTWGSTAFDSFGYGPTKDTYKEISYLYDYFPITVSGTYGTGSYPTDYSTGISGISRTGIGAFSFAENNFGHIGSFYFGPVDVSVSADILDVSAVLLDPTVTVLNSQSATIYPAILRSRHILLQPTVYATQDISVDFVGRPVSGPSPLVVEFTAIVNFSAELKNKYKVSQYRWCFDYDVDGSTCNEAWTTTTSNPITHVYRGYNGQKYSVRLCVTLELI